MKKTYNTFKTIAISSLFILMAITSGKASSGLVISEFLANPTGSDSPFEFVELIATKYIDFSATPYSVVFTNNGTATANGWIQGSGTTYGFNINSGTVNIGDIVYVGGSSMTPTGTHLKTIDTGTLPGDGFGSASTSGVLGNGGANSDGIAVFNLGISSVTASTVPVDAIFFGTGNGAAVVNAGVDGYQLPINDIYSGGKLQTSSFTAPDPASGKNIIATGGYNTTTNTFVGTRTWAIDSVITSGASLITLSGSTGIILNESISSITVFPNPINEQTTIKIVLKNAARVKSEVYNIIGEKLETIVDKEFATGENTISFNQKQPAGIYFIKTTIDGQETITKIVQR